MCGGTKTKEAVINKKLEKSKYLTEENKTILQWIQRENKNKGNGNEFKKRVMERILKKNDNEIKTRH